MSDRFHGFLVLGFSVVLFACFIGGLLGHQIIDGSSVSHAGRYRMYVIPDPLGSPTKETIMVDSSTGKAWQIINHADLKTGYNYTDLMPVNYWRGNTADQNEQQAPFTGSVQR
jgi:hypothetical protein